MRTREAKNPLEKASEEDISNILIKKTPVMRSLDRKQQMSTYFVFLMMIVLIAATMLRVNETLPDPVTMGMGIGGAIAFVCGIVYSVRISRLRTKIRKDQFRRLNEQTRDKQN